jgi:hypothetical protein
MLAWLAAGCGGPAAPAPTSDPTSDPTSVPTLVPSDADRPTADGGVVRRCGSHFAEEFDLGLEERTVRIGKVSVVSFRLAPAPSPPGRIRTFKVLVRLAAGAEARLETMTPDTALLYDRARFAETSHDSLSAGERSVQFTGCADRAAVFNGAILTTGPTAVRIRVHTQAGRSDRTITAYTG